MKTKKFLGRHVKVTGVASNGAIDKGVLMDFKRRIWGKVNGVKRNGDYRKKRLDEVGEAVIWILRGGFNVDCNEEGEMSCRGRRIEMRGGEVMVGKELWREFMGRGVLKSERI